MLDCKQQFQISEQKFWSFQKGKIQDTFVSVNIWLQGRREVLCMVGTKFRQGGLLCPLATLLCIWKKNPVMSRAPGSEMPPSALTSNTEANLGLGSSRAVILVTKSRRFGLGTSCSYGINILFRVWQFSEAAAVCFQLGPTTCWREMMEFVPLLCAVPVMGFTSQRRWSANVMGCGSV